MPPLLDILHRWDGSKRTLWHHDMETLSVLLDLCEGNRSVVDSPHKGPVMQSFDVCLLLAWTSHLTNTLLVIWDALMPMWHNHNGHNLIIHAGGLHFFSTSQSISWNEITWNKSMPVLFKHLTNVMIKVYFSEGDFGLYENNHPSTLHQWSLFLSVNFTYP